MGALIIVVFSLFGFGAAGAEDEAVLSWRVEADTGRVVVQRGGDAVSWEGGTLAQVVYWDGAGKEHWTALSPSAGWSIEEGKVDAGLELTCRQAETGIVLRFVFAVNGDVLTVSVPAGGIGEEKEARLKSVRLLPGFGAAHEGDEGYLVVAQQSGALCHFRGKKPEEHGIPVYQNIAYCPMPLFGMVRGKSGLAGIVTSGQFDARFVVSVNHGPQHEYGIAPTFTLRSFREETRLPEDLVVEYHFLAADEASWVGVGKRYRQYNLTQRGLRPLRDRVADSPELAYAAQSLEVRIRLGVKPVPCDVPEQTPENEPALRVFCTFERVRDIVDAFQRHGIPRAEFCLVGWNRGGHDGRYPQVFPVEPTLGGEAELRAAIQHAQSLGYQMVAHDCYCDAYRISEDWSEEYIRKKPDGTMCKGGVWGGGQSYTPCLARAYDLFAKRNMKGIRELGFRGLHYSDVLSIVGPHPCYDPNHPQTRRQDSEAAVRILAFAREQFGGIQSEGPLDFTAPALDRVLYIDADKWSPLVKKPYVDVRVPLYETVYHGVMLYTLSTETVNTQPGEAGYLRNIEYGGMPLAYFYGHFVLDESKNWLGQRDYRYDDPEGLANIVTELRRVHDDLEQLKHLQLEFIEDHRQVAEGVFETVYSNGERVLVNYGESPYAVSADVAVAPGGFCLLTEDWGRKTH